MKLECPWKNKEKGKKWGQSGSGENARKAFTKRLMLTARYMCQG